ncbi:hypothetical protein JCM5353_006560 [Sporobolomyces roseus]
MALQEVDSPPLLAALVPNPPRRRRRSRLPDRLSALPLELLYLVVSNLNLPALLAVSLVSKPLRSFILAPGCESKWLVAIEEMEIPKLDAKLRPVELASLVVGRWCRVCGKNNARKVDLYLRARLCPKCWEQELVLEGPDEPDPAFEEFYPGTKRYTPRSHPLADIDDFLTFTALPKPAQDKLNERHEWVKNVWKDGEKLTKWNEARFKAERAEKKETKEREKAITEVSNSTK